MLDGCERMSRSISAAWRTPSQNWFRRSTPNRGKSVWVIMPSLSQYS